MENYETFKNWLARFLTILIIVVISAAALLTAPHLETENARLVLYIAGFLDFLMIGGIITFAGGRKAFLTLLVGSFILVLILFLSPILRWTGLINSLAAFWPITAWPALVSAILLFFTMICGVFCRMFSNDISVGSYLGSD